MNSGQRKPIRNPREDDIENGLWRSVHLGNAHRLSGCVLWRKKQRKHTEKAPSLRNDEDLFDRLSCEPVAQLFLLFQSL